MLCNFQITKTKRQKFYEMIQFRAFKRSILSRLFKVTLPDTSTKYLTIAGIICQLALLSFLKKIGGN